MDNQTYDFPSDVDVQYPVPPSPPLTGAGGGVAAYRGNSDQLQDYPGFPGYAGEYELAFENAPGLAPQTVPMSVPGSVDLRYPRDTGSVPGTNTIIKSIGPVTGDDNDYSGLQGALYTPAPGNDGPVSGGSDYSQMLAASYFAGQMQMLSAEASASALISAV